MNLKLSLKKNYDYNTLFHDKYLSFFLVYEKGDNNYS